MVLSMLQVTFLSILIFITVFEKKKNMVIFSNLGETEEYIPINS